MKKSSAVQITFLSSIAAMTIGCNHPGVPVHLDASGRCMNEITGQPVSQQICYGRNGGYYGGTHYYYVPGSSARYYADPSSPGYVRPWTGSSSSSSPGSVSGTQRGVFGGSAEGHASGGHAGGGE